MKNYYLRKNKNIIMLKTIDGNLYIDLQDKYVEDQLEVAFKKIFELGQRYERKL